jgi:DNA gyrase inhibitor GyrI
MRFIREWLPGSRLEPARHPAIELYDTDFTIDPKTFAFSCLLCMPVR